LFPLFNDPSPPVPARYEGWRWKGDTSSDEVMGHIFAFTAVATLAPTAPQRAAARAQLVEIVGTIVDNGFVMDGVDGNATTWARWDPAEVNCRRSFSDERGLQSLQALAMLAAAANATGASARAATAEKFAAAYATLCNATNAYGRNALNAKIETPCDDNFSDDELTFLPYLTWFSASVDAHHAGVAFDPAPIVASLHRTHRVVASERSGLWEAIFFGAVGAGDASLRASAARDVKWNLRSWPLSHIHWAHNNSLRQDIYYQPGSDRFGRANVETSHARDPLPANERNQLRWNANPWALSNGAGDGRTESDPGAFLLPYWYSRYVGLLTAED
jgi:hypothetical protein